jgi:uncharacterized membrane protein
MGAAVGAFVSVAPSLIPRAALIQGLLMGVCAAIGYGIGTSVGWLIRRIRKRSEWAADHRTRIVVGLMVAMVLAMAWGAGVRWQSALADISGVPAPHRWWGPISIGSATAVFVVLLAMGRLIRRLTRALATVLGRLAPDVMARGLAAVMVTVIGAVVLGSLPRLAVVALHPVFRSANAATAPGVEPPTSDYVSGGPGSAIAWSDLGDQGRTFVAGVTSTSDLEDFSGRQAREPIRAFVGVDSAGTAQARAQLAVAELERFGAFGRAVIAVGTSAGAGIVDPSQVVPLEYLYNGDVATVSTQYSILPSFLSFAVDRPNSVAESKAVIEAVRERLLQVPAGERPRMVVFGESLGAFGASGAFEDLADLLRRTDGAMFQGPPNATSLWQRYTDDRQPGSPEHLPVYEDGRRLRWANQPQDLASPPEPFAAPRIVYLQNSSDPVVWWSPATIWSRPDWLAEPRANGVLPGLPWLPVVTFIGLSGDMMDSQSVPVGHGHVYGTAPVVAWADILRPPGWRPGQTVKLQQHLGG